MLSILINLRRTLAGLQALSIVHHVFWRRAEFLVSLDYLHTDHNRKWSLFAQLELQIWHMKTMMLQCIRQVATTLSILVKGMVVVLALASLGLASPC